MARINIDDSIYRDSRFIKLVNLTKDYYRAIGLLVGAWSLAQKHYLNESNGRSIPLNEWERTDFGPILEVGLAKKIGSNVKLCGSDEQFSWLLQRSNAGKKHKKVTKTVTVVDRDVTVVDRDVTVEQPLTLTPTLTPTHSIYYKYKNIAQSDKPDMSDLVFFDFESVYKKYPRKEGKSRGFKIFKVQIKTNEDFEKITRAIENYSEYCLKNVREVKYIKHFSTFMSEWRDWIDFKENKEIEMTEEQLNKFYGVE